MERAGTKLWVILTVFLVVLVWNVEGGRRLKENGDKVEQPQNYFGSFGGTGAVIPTPFGPTIAFGPTGFCSFPGVGCVRVQPQQPTVPTGGAVGSTQPPPPPQHTVPAVGSTPPPPPSPRRH